MRKSRTGEARKEEKRGKERRGDFEVLSIYRSLHRCHPVLPCRAVPCYAVLGNSVNGCTAQPREDSLKINNTTATTPDHRSTVQAV